MELTPICKLLETVHEGFPRPKDDSGVGVEWLDF